MKGTFSTLKQILKQSEHATGFLEGIIPMKQEKVKKETGTEKGKQIQFITTSKKKPQVGNWSHSISPESSHGTLTTWNNLLLGAWQEKSEQFICWFISIFFAVCWSNTAPKYVNFLALPDILPGPSLPLSGKPDLL